MGGAGKVFVDALTFGQVGGNKVNKSLKSYIDPKKPKIPGQSADTSDADAAAAGERERQAMARRRGRASTILTGPLGDLNPAQLGRKVLTGS